MSIDPSNSFVSNCKTFSCFKVPASFCEKSGSNGLLFIRTHLAPLSAGLAHLHSLSPRVVHKDFKTANVLVDENFIAKVADAGIRNFLGRVDIAGSSSQVTADEMFLAPE